ncbi:hypothetical protein QGM71_15795 [Virgibacillus sp. C22-A2]|uniref:Uncharacterized protein n=1 Tax=Virgibacillus tibetensis TaxID=3042313 RepID=A0ABU6KJ95_9BACI|nr:hypothetical protein [Virgibacillus sp. C22-A2]
MKRLTIANKNEVLKDEATLKDVRYISFMGYYQHFNLAICIMNMTYLKLLSLTFGLVCITYLI